VRVSVLSIITTEHLRGIYDYVTYFPLFHSYSYFFCVLLPRNNNNNNNSNIIVINSK